MIKVWFDGGCGPINPGGYGTIGVHVTHKDKVIYQASECIGHGPEISCNVAEYVALITALLFLKKKGYHLEPIVICGDSKLVINQMNKVWRAKNGLYFRYYLEARDLCQEFMNLTFYWVRRDHNTIADGLSRGY